MDARSEVTASTPASGTPRSDALFEAFATHPEYGYGRLCMTLDAAQDLWKFTRMLERELNALQADRDVWKEAFESTQRLISYVERSPEGQE